MLVISLDDFSVLYRVSGFLAEVKNLITVKSTLKKRVLDVLHENGVEIVSPAFMNQRQLVAAGVKTGGATKNDTPIVTPRPLEPAVASAAAVSVVVTR